MKTGEINNICIIDLDNINNPKCKILKTLDMKKCIILVAILFSGMIFA